MPKVSIHKGLTLELPNQKFGFIRADVTYSDIDTDGDVEVQIAACRAVAISADEDAEGALAQQISDASGLDFEGLGVTKQFNEFRAKIGAWASKVNTRLESLTPTNPAVMDAGKAPLLKAKPKAKSGKNTEAD